MSETEQRTAERYNAIVELFILVAIFVLEMRDLHLDLAVLGQMQVTPGCPETDAGYTWLSRDVLGQMQVTPGCPGTALCMAYLPLAIV